jgi:DNA repair exonuclease SbcCD ATPase subunit
MRDDIIKKIKKIQGTNNIKNWRNLFTEDELNDIQKTIKHLNIYKYENFSEIRACYINKTSEQQYCPVCGKKCSYDRHAKNTYNILVDYNFAQNSTYFVFFTAQTFFNRIAMSRSFRERYNTQNINMYTFKSELSRLSQQICYDLIDI